MTQLRSIIGNLHAPVLKRADRVAADVGEERHVDAVAFSGAIIQLLVVGAATDVHL